VPRALVPVTYHFDGGIISILIPRLFFEIAKYTARDDFNMELPFARREEIAATGTTSSDEAGGRERES
jgi:hypothetical protein